MNNDWQPVRDEVSGSANRSVYPLVNRSASYLVSGSVSRSVYDSVYDSVFSSVFWILKQEINNEQ